MLGSMRSGSKAAFDSLSKTIKPCLKGKDGC